MQRDIAIMLTRMDTAKIITQIANAFRRTPLSGLRETSVAAPTWWLVSQSVFVSQARKACLRQRRLLRQNIFASAGRV